jgi:hypothetical protein
MKTTVDISAPLLRRAKAVARREGRTLRDLVEAGLRKEIGAGREVDERFELRDVSVQGRGLRVELRNASFDEILELSYGERG